MDAGKGNIYRILDGNKQYILPVYQRFYSWGKSEWQQLWSDIVEMIHRNKSAHFVGSVVSVAYDNPAVGVQQYVIIDGQQRLTTLSILLLALRNYLKSLATETDNNIARKVENTYLINRDENDNKRYKLLLTETDREVYISLIENTYTRKNLYNKSRIPECLEFFKDKISKMSDEKITPQDIFDSMGRLQIASIDLDNTDDPQAIFESLNSTGKKLSESDLIRNYILMNIHDYDVQKQIYDNYWRPLELLFEGAGKETEMDAFFRDYLTSRYCKISKVENVYKDFKQCNYLPDIAATEELCADLYERAIDYTDMIYAKSDDNELRALYKDLVAMRMAVAYPFLMSVRKDCHKQKCTLEEYKEIVQICMSYVFRRYICSHTSTKSHGEIFASLKSKIVEKDYLNSAKAAFVLLKDHKVFPKDDEFVSDFILCNVYKMAYRNFILNRLENFQNRTPVTIEDLTIEHIMPENPNLRKEWQIALGEDWQNVHKKYVDTIGNITLADRAYNSRMSDLPFMQKMNCPGGFRQCAVRLNSYVIEQKDWNEDNIQQRAMLLADKALKIWRYPSITEEQLDSYREKPEVSKYTIDSYNLTETANMLYELLHNRIMNLGLGIKQEFKQQYIAYKFDTNFVDLQPQKQRIVMFVNFVNSEDVVDPYNLCEDVSCKGHTANGDFKIIFANMSDIDKVMNIVEQAYNMQRDE